VSPIISLRDYFRDEVMEHVELGACPLERAEAVA
jgi:hypothetical protein